MLHIKLPYLFNHRERVHILFLFLQYLVCVLERNICIMSIYIFKAFVVETDTHTQTRKIPLHSPVVVRWKRASGAMAAHCGAAARRCSPVRRWHHVQLERGSGSVGS